MWVKWWRRIRFLTTERMAVDVLMEKDVEEG